MSMVLITAFQGQQKNYQALQIVNNDGTPAANVFTAGSVLSASVWEGQNQAAIFTTAPTWYTASGAQTGYTQGQFSLALTGTNTALLNPGGEYYCLVSQTTGGVTAPVWQARLKIFATPGSVSPAPPDLITYDYAEAYCSPLGLTDSQRDVLPYLVSAASHAVRRECFNRNFDQRTYSEFHDVIQEQIRVFQPPVQIVTRVQGSPQTALTISNTSAQAAQAYFATTGSWNGYGANAQTVTGINLNAIANGAATLTPVLFTVGQTISSLATAINAVGSGWTALADSTLGLWPVTELDGGYVAQGCAAGAISSSGAQFSILQDLAPNWFSLDTRRIGFLTVGRQYANSLAGQWGPGGDQMFGDGQGNQTGRVKVTYIGGDLTIPSEIQRLTAELVKFNLATLKTDLLLESETAQEYEYKISLDMVSAMPKHIRQGLAPWRNWRA